MSNRAHPYRVDSVYFFILFDDPDLRVPIIRTLQFIKEAYRDDGTLVLMFRDLSSKDKSDKLVFDDASVSEVVLGGAELLARLERSFAGILASPQS